MEKPSQPLNVVIIGGSIAGLMSGILLKRYGHNVRILEQNESSVREGTAAGIGLALNFKEFFDVHDRLKETPMGVLNPEVSVIDEHFNVKYPIPIHFNMTTWDTAYYRLRANFDGMKSPYCPQPPIAGSAEGDGTVMIGHIVRRVDPINGGVAITVDDVRTGQSKRIEADIAIAADGANSGIRRQLCPSLRREEPGYVIWRGIAATEALPKHVLDKIEGRCIIFPAEREYSYCMIYTMPGEVGNLAPGKRHLNFAWYFWPTSPSLTQIMTGTDGHVHRSTVPKGKLQPDVWAAQLEVGRRIFPPDIFAVLEKVTQPFVSIVSSVGSPRAAHFDNRLFLIGDALTQAQPNVGMGGNLAATAAMSLVELIGPAGSAMPTTSQFAEWEKKTLQFTQITRVRSVAFASWYLCSWVGIGWYWARFYAVWWWQKLFEGRANTYSLFKN